MLTRQAIQLLPQALAKATQTNYKRSWSRFSQFAEFIGINVCLPISIRYACLFLVYLFNHQFSSNSISTIMSGLSYYHKIRLLQDPFQYFPVRQLLQSIRKISPSSPDTRRPISEHLLLQLIDNLHRLGLPLHETTLFSTMFLFAFYFGLRISEYTASRHNLLLEEVQVSINSVVIKFHSFKHS